MNKNITKTVLVAGAGIAGLACTQKLLEAGFKVVFLEASHQYGGRIRPLNNFLNICMEAGGQEIHHRNTDYHDMALKAGAILQNDADSIMVVWDPYQKKMIDQNELEEKYPLVDGILDHFAQEYPTWAKDTNTFDHLQQTGHDMNFLHYYSCLMAGEYGAPLNKISAKGIGLCESTFFCEVNHSFTNINHKTVLDKFFSKATDIISYNCPVVEVTLKDQKVTVKYLKDKVIQEIVKKCRDFQEVDYFVSAIPITQVKKIIWEPKFTSLRQSQLDLVTMSKGGKLFVKLNKHFQNREWGYIIINSKQDIQIWNNSTEEECCIVALLSDVGSQEIDLYGVDKYVEGIINDLNTQCEEDFKVVKTHFMNWGQEQYIEGLYSYPLAGIEENYRQIIGEPIENKIFFCGEAYHTVYYSTMTGAMETGYNVAEAIQNL